MAKTNFYVSKQSSPSTLLRLPTSILLMTSEDDVWTWLYQRTVAVKGYEKKFAAAVASEKLRPATAEELYAHGVKFSDQQLKSLWFWFDTTADANSGKKIVTRQFQFPSMTCETSKAGFTALQDLTGRELPFVVCILGKVKVEIAVYAEGTSPKK